VSDTKTWREWAADGSITFWDCDDGREVLRHESLEEAIEHDVDDLPQGDVEAAVREAYPGGITVYGFRRREVDRDWLEQQAARMAEDFAEQLEDEFGDHLTGTHQTLEDDDEKALGTGILALLEKLKLVPWQCEQVAKVHLSLDELLAMLRETAPSWFEKDGVDNEKWRAAR